MATIREGRSSDLSDIARLHAESWREGYRGMMPDAFLDGPVFENRRARWEERFAALPGGAVLLIAEREGAFAGFLYSFPEPTEPDWDELDNLHIEARCRGRGIGEALMREYATRLTALGRHKVLLYVMEGNDGACRFYERLGGKRQAIFHKGFAGEGPFPMIPYRWDDFSALLRSA